MFDTSKACAQALDAQDELAEFRQRFLIPERDGRAITYLCGHSLGLQPTRCLTLVQEELARWANLAVAGHFVGEPSWQNYQQTLMPDLGMLVGAKTSEVVAMNGLSVNLHMLLNHFYKPSRERYKILIEKPVFPSDRYAVVSQLACHGYSSDEALIEVSPQQGAHCLTRDEIVQAIRDEGESLAIVMLSGVNYLTGQFVPIADITYAGHSVGALVGFDLAHAVGNVPLKLHDW